MSQGLYMRQSYHSIIKAIETQIIYAKNERILYTWALLGQPAGGWIVFNQEMTEGKFWQKNDGEHVVHSSGDLKFKQGAGTRVENKLWMSHVVTK